MIYTIVYVGGSTPVFDEIVISMSSLNKVISIDEVSGTVHGTIIHDLSVVIYRNSCL